MSNQSDEEKLGVTYRDIASYIEDKNSVSDAVGEKLKDCIRITNISFIFQLVQEKLRSLKMNTLKLIVMDNMKELGNQVLKELDGNYQLHCKNSRFSNGEGKVVIEMKLETKIFIS